MTFYTTGQRRHKGETINKQLRLIGYCFPDQGACYRTFFFHSEKNIPLQNLNRTNIGLIIANIDLSFQFTNVSLAHHAALISTVIFYIAAMISLSHLSDHWDVERFPRPTAFYIINVSLSGHRNEILSLLFC